MYFGSVERVLDVRPFIYYTIHHPASEFFLLISFGLVFRAFANFGYNRFQMDGNVDRNLLVFRFNCDVGSIAIRHKISLTPEYFAVHCGERQKKHSMVWNVL